VEFRDFRDLVERLAAEVPAKYLEGIVGIEVSPETVPHPLYPSVYTLGECIPVETAAEPLPSRVVLYHGSFRQLARQRADFDWRAEAWETLTHELRHHLEQRAGTGVLDDYDWAAEQNFRRQAGEAFDPAFYLSGERVTDRIYAVDDDLFWDHEVRGPLPSGIEIAWHGRRFQAAVPAGRAPMFLVLEGLEPEPVGEVIYVFRRKARLWDLLRRSPGPVVEHVRVRPVA
jgi:hypothetical protein